MSTDWFRNLCEMAVRMPSLTDGQQLELVTKLAQAKKSGDFRTERICRNKLIMWSSSLAIKVGLEEARRFDDNVEEAVASALYLLCTGSILEGFKFHKNGIRLSRYIEMGVRANLKKEARKLRGRFKISVRQWESLEKFWAIKAQNPTATPQVLQDLMQLTSGEFADLLELESMLGNIADLDFQIEDGLALHGVIADPKSLPENQEEHEQWTLAHEFVTGLADSLGIGDEAEINEVLQSYLEGDFSAVQEKYGLGDWAYSAIEKGLHQLRQALA